MKVNQALVAMLFLIFASFSATAQDKRAMENYRLTTLNALNAERVIVKDSLDQLPHQQRVEVEAVLAKYLILMEADFTTPADMYNFISFNFKSTPEERLKIANGMYYSLKYLQGTPYWNSGFYNSKDYYLAVDKLKKAYEMSADSAKIVQASIDKLKTVTDPNGTTRQVTVNQQTIDNLKKNFGLSVDSAKLVAAREILYTRIEYCRKQEQNCIRYQNFLYARLDLLKIKVNLAKLANLGERTLANAGIRCDTNNRCTFDNAGNPSGSVRVEMDKSHIKKSLKKLKKQRKANEQDEIACVRELNLLMSQKTTPTLQKLATEMGSKEEDGK